jgi:predicted RNA-binding protein with PIN domain
LDYILDGYNILFHHIDSPKAFADQREDLIHYLQMRFALLGLKGLLIFDGSHRREEISGRAYRSPLEIVYTPKGQNADSYILEQIELAKNPKDITLVTNDAGLKRQARALRAHVQSNKDFIIFLKQTHPKKEKHIQETPKNMERLLKIFEDRFRQKEE